MTPLYVAPEDIFLQLVAGFLSGIKNVFSPLLFSVAMEKFIA